MGWGVVVGETSSLGLRRPTQPVETGWPPADIIVAEGSAHNCGITNDCFLCKHCKMTIASWTLQGDAESSQRSYFLLCVSDEGALTTKTTTVAESNLEPLLKILRIKSTSKIIHPTTQVVIIWGSFTMEIFEYQNFLGFKFFIVSSRISVPLTSTFLFGRLSTHINLNHPSLVTVLPHSFHPSTPHS